jgi:hypothetical protein
LKAEAIAAADYGSIGGWKTIPNPPAKENGETWLPPIQLSNRLALLKNIDRIVIDIHPPLYPILKDMHGVVIGAEIEDGVGVGLGQ